jgi:hypothetical protein
LSIKDEKIFIYLRLRDDKETLLRSRIREFAAIGKLLAEFMREVWNRFGLQMLKIGNLEYIDANTDIVLASFKKDPIRQQVIISGIIPKDYQTRMLDEENTRIKFPITEFVEKISPDLDPLHKAIIEQRLQRSTNILSLIKQSINENGEFYIVLNTESL